MNLRAPALTSSLPTLVEPSSTPTSHEGIAKPKVMRRPAQFSKPTARNEPALMADTRIESGAPTAQSSAPHAPSLRPWQDDARFALALLAIVIAVNVALSVWLAPAPTASAPPPQAEKIAPMTELPEATTSAPESLIHQLNEAGASVSEQ